MCIQAVRAQFWNKTIIGVALASYLEVADLEQRPFFNDYLKVCLLFGVLGLVSLMVAAFVVWLLR